MHAELFKFYCSIVHSTLSVCNQHLRCRSIQYASNQIRSCTLLLTHQTNVRYVTTDSSSHTRLVVKRNYYSICTYKFHSTGAI